MLKQKYLHILLLIAVFISGLCYVALYKSTLYSDASILLRNCDMDNCFSNKRKFASRFKAFVYPPKTGETPYKHLLYGKDYFTDDPNTTCVFVYFFDKDIRNLRELKYWGENGENHLIMNLDNQNMESFDLGVALIAQSTFSARKFRPGFDFLSPFYNEAFSDRIWELLTPIFPLKRKWLLSYMHISYNDLKESSVYQKNKENLCRLIKTWHNNPSKLQLGKILFDCPDGLLNWKTQPKGKQSRIFAESMFTVILVPTDAQASVTFQRLLMNALYNGAIPILVSAGTKIENLPLQEYVTWNKIVVWISFADITDIPSRIQTFTEADIKQMKQDGRYAVEMLLSHKNSILACILETIKERLHLPAIGFQESPSQKLFIRYPNGSAEETNYKQSNAYDYGRHSLAKMTIPSNTLSFFDPDLGVGKSWPDEKFTILIVTYHREKVLKQIITQYKGLPFVDRIVLVWNAQDIQVNKNLIPDIGIPIYVVGNGINTLNNRFLPFDVIRTQAVFTVDDDITLDNGDILFAFRVWRQNRDRIVGFPARAHRWDAQRNKWIYIGGNHLGLSLTLTGATFLHKHYFYIYSYVMKSAIRESVHKKMNCEDLAMNMLVAHVTKKSPIKVNRQQSFLNKYHLRDGLSLKSHHGQKRDACLNEFAQIYGYMPLVYTQYIADYQMNKREYNKRFYNVL